MKIVVVDAASTDFSLLSCRLVTSKVLAGWEGGAYKIFVQTAVTWVLAVEGVC